MDDVPINTLQCCAVDRGERNCECFLITIRWLKYVEKSQTVSTRSVRRLLN